ncbi:MAG: hypothetical protein ACQGVK_18415 [Myxococcota bacterium]
MSKPRLRVRPGRPEDEPVIGQLLDRLLDDPRPLDVRRRLWRWRSDENPARSDRIPGFLVAEKGDAIVAVHGLLPLRMRVAGRELVVSSSCDLAADPRARSAGMRIKLAAMSPDLAPMHLSTSANESANKITLALEGLEMPIGRGKWIKPLRASGLLVRALRARGGAWRALAGLVGWAALPVDGLLALGRRWTSVPDLPGLQIEEGAAFDARFDRLWARLVDRCAVSVVRDAAYLEWRYARYPFAGIEWLAVSGDGEVEGFAAWHTSVDEDGLCFAALLDCEAPEGRVLERLLVEVIRRAGRAGAHYVVARTADDRLRQAMERRGFRLREGGHSQVTYKAADELPEDLLADAGSWSLSLGDGDGCFFYEGR